MSTTSNQEFFRIQAWIAEWTGTSVEECKYKWEDIREICRGPMREVLLDFVLPRFRTDEQIKVIRSNLYLNDIARIQSQDDARTARTGQLDGEIEDLKKKLVEIQKEKTDMIRQISTHQVMLNESKMEMQQTLLENVTYFKNLDSHSKFVRNRVAATNALLESLQHAKCRTGAALSTLSLSHNDLPSSDSASPHLTLLKSLYNNTTDLFNIYFLQDSNSTIGSQSNTSEIQALTSAVSLQTTELRQSGVSPDLMEAWARREQDNSANRLKNAGHKFSDVMSPVEELTSEADALHIKLMKAFVDLHFKNRAAEKTVQELESQNSKKIQNTVLNDALIVPADLLALIQKEEQLAQFNKCRELNLELAESSNVNQVADEDLLKLFGGGSSLSKTSLAKKTTHSHNEQNGNASRVSTGLMQTNMSQEALEDLACALLKSFPQSERQLEATIKHCRNLVFDKFPKIFHKDGSANVKSKVNIESGRRDFTSGNQYDDVQVQIPSNLLVNYDLLASSPVESEPTDLVEELFRLQNELEKKRSQCKIVLNEFDKSKE
ncbi:unnamed protein product [Orchesella dallaii]|uniref:Uncharacterized protein n=1 Tax=Orchesella dallaii TaxID=48710 RepID=A0ABP1RA77_9HEXA